MFHVKLWFGYISKELWLEAESPRHALNAFCSHFTEEELVHLSGFEVKPSW